MLAIPNDCKSALNTTKTGWFKFYRSVAGTLQSLGRDADALTLTEEGISFHQNALQQSLESQESNGESPELHEEALAQNYWDLGNIQYHRGNYTEAIISFTRARDIIIKLFGEENSKTADSYLSVGVTQNLVGNYTAALESAQRALNIRIKLFGEEHSDTHYSYQLVGITQYSLRDYTAALESHKRALDIRIKLMDW